MGDDEDCDSPLRRRRRRREAYSMLRLLALTFSLATVYHTTTFSNLTYPRGSKNLIFLRAGEDASRKRNSTTAVTPPLDRKRPDRLKTDPLKCSRLITQEAIGWKAYSNVSYTDTGSISPSKNLANETTWRFQVPIQAVEACGFKPSDQNPERGEDPYFNLYPLQSSPQDIADSMAGKHIILLGDSSLRMLYDYLVGRAVGDYTHWPANVSNHGPQEHSNNCGGSDEESATCAYHFYWNTGLISFYWANGHSNTAFEKYRHELVGSPSLVIATFGYWNKDDIEGGGHHGDEMISSEFIQAIDSTVNHQEMNETYPNAYDTEYKIKKIFMTTFSDEIVSSQNATKIAKSYGWGIFDRTRIRKPGMPLDTPLRQRDHVKAHPMDVVLEIELELLLAVIRATPQQRVGFRQ